MTSTGNRLWRIPTLRIFRTYVRTLCTETVRSPVNKKNIMNDLERPGLPRHEHEDGGQTLD
jgi:hypothetical protein